MNPRFLLLALLLPLSACTRSVLRDGNPSPPASTTVVQATASSVVPPPNPNVQTPDAPTRPLDLQVHALGDDATATTDALPPPEPSRAAQTLPTPSLPGGKAQRQNLLDTSGDYLRRMDTDGDGRVSQDEFIAWMSYSFNARDVNHDDVLSGDELPGGKGTPITRAAFRENLRQRFNGQDTDHDGYLNAKELAAPPR